MSNDTSDSLVAVSPTTGRTFAETEAELRRVFKIAVDSLDPGSSVAERTHPWWR